MEPEGNEFLAVQYENNIDAVRAFAIIAASLSLLISILWATFPLLNTLYVWTNSVGAIVDTKYHISWVMIFILSLNVLLPYLLFFVVVDPTQQARSDTYFIVSVLMIFLNTLVVIGFLGYWMVWINVSWSGAEPFNDYSWCCYYADQHPELCPNTPFFPCDPPVNFTDLRPNGEFVTHWIFAGVFWLASLGHFLLHRLLHVEGLVTRNVSSKREGVLLALFFTFLNLALFLYWAAVPLLNTLYIHGYPLFAIPPSPGPFVSTLYQWGWWFIWGLTLNVLPLALFMLGLADRKTFFIPTLHYWVAIIVIVGSLIVTLALGIIWLSNCNYSWSAGSICNSYEYCSRFFADAPEICPNVTPFNPEPVLRPNAEFIQHLIFSVVFWIFSGTQIWLNLRMKHYGVFHEM